MAPWIWRGDRDINVCVEVGLHIKEDTHLSDARVPDVSRVQRDAPVSVNLLCGGKHIGSDFSASVFPDAGRGRELTLAGTAPAVQAEDGLGGDEEGQGAGLEQRQSEGTRSSPSAVSKHIHPSHTSSPQTPAHSPDAHGGLDQRGDPHCGENGPDQLTDGALVSADAHGFGQEEGHGDGAAEAGEVVLQAAENRQSAGNQPGCFGKSTGGVSVYLQSQQDAQVPRGDVLDGVDHVRGRRRCTAGLLFLFVSPSSDLLDCVLGQVTMTLLRRKRHAR